MSKMKKKNNYGFTIAEILMALALLGILMAAVAAAFNASSMSYSENENSFKSMNMARQALVRMTAELRTASGVLISEPNSQCTLINASGDDITYQYNSSDDMLYLITNDTMIDDDYALCENITAISFIKDTAFDGEGTEYVKSVQISLTVSLGRTQQKISGAVVTRRTM